MKSQKTQCLLIETWKPNPVEIQVGRTPVKEGKSLPNSETEDVGGLSLCPTYSAKQLRRIERLRVIESERRGIKDLTQILKSGGRLQW